MVRKAVPADVGAIRALIEENQDTILNRGEDEILSLVDAFWVVEDSGEVVGCACLEVYSPKIAEIRTVAVRSDKRRNGYGRLLVETAVREAERLAIREIMVVTSDPDYFTKLNFGPCLNEKYALFYQTRKHPR